MSSTLTGTAVAPVVVAPLKAAPAGAHSRPHIVAFDIIRLVIMVFVVGDHTLAFGGGPITVAAGAVITAFHTSRYLFLMLTALVLTYNYGHRDHLNWPKFWWRRYWLVVPAYVTWSVIYYAADGGGRGPFPSALVHDLLTSDARYQLYFLLVLELLALLLVAVPIVYTLAWVFTSAARTTRVSLLLTGREYAKRR